MPQLIVVGFKQDLCRAASVLNRLPFTRDCWLIDLDDAVAVYRDQNGRLTVDPSCRKSSGQETGWGLFLLGMTLAVPCTKGAPAVVVADTPTAEVPSPEAGGSGGGAIDAHWFKDELGIPEEFIKEVGGLVAPGDSAIFALLRTGDPALVAERFRDYDGTILQTALTNEQTAKVHSVLSGWEHQLARAS